MARRFAVVLALAAMFAAAPVPAEETPCSPQGEVLTIYNSDGGLIGVMWTPYHGVTTSYIAGGPDGIPRFVARRQATTDDIRPAQSIDEAERVVGW